MLVGTGTYRLHRSCTSWTAQATSCDDGVQVRTINISYVIDV